MSGMDASARTETPSAKYQLPHSIPVSGRSAHHVDLHSNDDFRPQQPTHFLAVPLTDDTSIAEALKAIHASLLSHDSRLLRACAPLCTAHVTLGVLHLPTGAPNCASVKIPFGPHHEDVLFIQAC